MPPAGERPAPPVAPAPEKTPPAPEPARTAEPTVPGPEKAATAEPEKAATPSKGLATPEWWEDRENFYLNAKNLIRQGRKQDALEVLEDVLALDPTHVAAVVDKAEIYRELGRSAEMIPDIEAALARNAKDPTLLQELAYSHLAAGREIGRAHV